jgi:hypothetical protein
MLSDAYLLTQRGGTLRPTAALAVCTSRKKD